MSIGNELLMIFILILVNAVLAMSEAALVASRKARLQQQAGEGNKSSALAIKLIEDPNIFLSTIQIGITLIGVLAGAVGGATIAESLAVAKPKTPKTIGLAAQGICFERLLYFQRIKTTLALWPHILVTAAQRAGTRTATTVYRRVILNRFTKGLALAPAR